MYVCVLSPAARAPGKRKRPLGACPYNNIAPDFQGGPPGTAGPEEANWDNSIPIPEKTVGFSQ